MRTVDVTWDQVAGKFDAIGSMRGHTVAINSPGLPEEHKRPAGFSPAELLLAGMGSCSLWDIVEILRKSRQEVTDLRVRVTSEQEADPPWTFRKVHLHYLFVAETLDPAVAARAVRLSVDKYCSVISTVRHAATVTDSFEVVRDLADAAGAPEGLGQFA